MSALSLELAKIVLFLSSSPLTFKLRMISSMVVLAQHGEVSKALHVVRLATHKVLVRRWQILESLVTDITGGEPSLLYPTTLIPSSNNMNFLTNPASTLAGPGASR